MKWVGMILNTFYLTQISKILLPLQHEINLKLSMRYFPFLKYEIYEVFTTWSVFPTYSTCPFRLVVFQERRSYAHQGLPHGTLPD